MIKILHLYYDLMNLYGENGNIKALTLLLDQLKVKYILDKKTINDEFNPLDYDFIYIGSGTEKNKQLALNHLIKYKDQLKEYIENNKMILVTGTAIELFGQSMIIKEKETTALGIFNFKSTINKDRIVKEVFAKSNITNQNVIGFINQNSITNIDLNYLFTHNNEKDGYKYKHFYATNFLGPILVRNPHILTYMVEKMLNTKITNPNLGFELEAFNSFIKKYEKK